MLFAETLLQTYSVVDDIRPDVLLESQQESPIYFGHARVSVISVDRKLLDNITCEGCKIRGNWANILCKSVHAT